MILVQYFLDPPPSTKNFCESDAAKLPWPNSSDFATALRQAVSHYNDTLGIAPGSRLQCIYTGTEPCMPWRSPPGSSSVYALGRGPVFSLQCAVIAPVALGEGPGGAGSTPLGLYERARPPDRTVGGLPGAREAWGVTLGDVAGAFQRCRSRARRSRCCNSGTGLAVGNLRRPS